MMKKRNPWKQARKRGLYKSHFSWNKGFKEYFAVKRHQSTILKIFKRRRMRNRLLIFNRTYDVRSLGGFDGSEIMFSSNDAPSRRILFWQIQLGATINLDDIYTYRILKRMCRNPRKDFLSLQSRWSFRIRNRYHG